MHTFLLVGLLTTSAPDAGNAPRALEFPDHGVLQSELEGRTLYELTLMRNYPFARAGNAFRKSWLRDYFARQGLSAGGLDEEKLSPIDLGNAEKIAAYE